MIFFCRSSLERASERLRRLRSSWRDTVQPLATPFAAGIDQTDLGALDRYSTMEQGNELGTDASRIGKPIKLAAG